MTRLSWSRCLREWGVDKQASASMIDSLSLSQGGKNRNIRRISRPSWLCLSYSAREGGHIYRISRPAWFILSQVEWKKNIYRISRPLVLSSYVYLPPATTTTFHLPFYPFPFSSSIFNPKVHSTLHKKHQHFLLPLKCYCSVFNTKWHSVPLVSHIYIYIYSQICIFTT